MAVASGGVNQVKTRLQALGLLDRTFANATDDEITAAVDALDDDHRDAIDQIVAGELGPASIREAIIKGRLDGSMESIALVLTDGCLADCIAALGDHADTPTSDELREVLPDLVENHGLAITQMMLASTVAGDAPASAIIRDLLKRDDLVKLPPAEPKPLTPMVEGPEVDPDERAAVKAKRREQKQRKQDEARVRREQSARDRHRT
jgi:hypothetical protein